MFIGIDGGGTKTAGVLIDGSGRLLAQQTTGSTNANAVGPEAARERLATLVAALLSAAGSAGPVSAVGLGISGAGRPVEQALLHEWMGYILPGVRCVVDNDAMIALAAATGGRLFGVVIISGTGMIVAGIDQNGQRRRAGGWGPLIGEPGGGFALGTGVLKAVADAADEIGPPTVLTAALLSELALTSPEELIPWAYRDLAWARFAGLAPLAVRAAQAGDSAAQHIVEEGVAALARAVAAVVRGLKLADQSFPFVLTGGNLQPGLLADQLAPRLHAIAPYATIARPEVDPAVGAALLAKQMLEREPRN